MEGTLVVEPCAARPRTGYHAEVVRSGEWLDGEKSLCPLPVVQ